MIKLNLLPGYVHEKGRIRLSIIIFVIVVALEVGVILWAKQGYDAQAQWFTKDKAYYTKRTEMINQRIEDSKKLSGPSTQYATLITFFSRKPVVEYAGALGGVMKAVPAKLGSTDAWFDSMTINKKDVTLNGKIKGIMNFVDFYFKTKDAGFTVKPGDPGPLPFPENPRTQEIPITLTCALDVEIPETVKAPDGVSPWPALYKKRGEGAAPAEGDPNAPPADPNAPPADPNAP